MPFHGRRDLSGHRFGRLTVQEFAGYVVYPSAKHARWKCLCDCGETRVVNVTFLRNGDTKSCGCLNRELTAARMRRHGHTIGALHARHGQSRDSGATREYRVWQAMLDRCRRPKATVFKHYGGRGISVCERWRDSFENFFADMGPCLGLTLERIDNNGNYEPGNVRWATQREQMSNTRRNRFIEINGEQVTLAEAARRLGTKEYTLRRRIKAGDSVAQILARQQPRTHCKHGHALTTENLSIDHGRQRCRTCILIAKTKWNRKHRAALHAD